MKAKKDLDSTTLAASFARMQPALEALSGDTLLQPNVDLETAGMAAIVLVDRANTGDRRARLDLLPAALFPKSTLEDLENAANAAMHVEIESAREGAAATGVKVDVAVITEASTLRERMLKTADYNLGDRDTVARELADIRLGSGYLDLANDCTRLAALYVTYKADLAADKRLYEATDAKAATDAAAKIRSAYRAAASRADVYAELRPRAFTELTRLYNEVRAAAQFVFRAAPSVLDDFPPLRSAVVELRPTRRTKSVDAPDPAPEPSGDGGSTAGSGAANGGAASGVSGVSPAQAGATAASKAPAS